MSLPSRNALDTQQSWESFKAWLLSVWDGVQNLDMYLQGGEAWAPLTAYTATPIRQWVVESGQAYIAISNHTSTAVFADDLAAGKWLAADVPQLIVDMAKVTGAAMVGSDDGASGTLWTTVAGFIERSEAERHGESVLRFFIAGEATARPMFQRALDAAKGADGTGVGRTVFSLYVPTPVSGYYDIDDTLVIDGTHGLHIYGDSALTERENTFPTGAIRWTGATSKPMIQIKGGTGTPSNPNFQIKISDICISGHTSFIAPGSIPTNLALSGIHIGALDGQNENTLNRNVVLENVRITDCRFGVWSGNPDGLNTDHALVTLSNSMIYRNAQAGVCWGTGNAILAAEGNFIGNNGWAATDFAADDYMVQMGANVYVTAGYVDLISTTTAGSGTYKPYSADIYQESGRLSIINAWSDTEGYFLYQGSASTSGGVYHVGQITGVRHFNSSFDATNTPNSMRLVVPGQVVSSCTVYGNIEVVSGLSGRPVFSGINFIRSGATFTGSGVTTQRSLIHIGHGAGNAAQIFTGGADTGVALTHKGNKAPQWLSMGNDAASLSLLQCLGPASSSSGFQVKLEVTTGQLQILVNGYFSGTDAATPLNVNRAMFYYTFGGSTNMMTLWSYDPNGSASEVALSSFTKQGGLLSANTAGSRSEVTFQTPLRAAAPSYSSGDYWEGSIYYNTTTNKLQVNTGAGTWVDLH